VNEVLAGLARHRIVPVLTVDEPRHGRPLLEALTAGGLPCAEVTFRTPGAADALREMTAAAGSGPGAGSGSAAGPGSGGALVGAGSVLRPEQVDAALAAGARFIVTPGLSVAVVRACLEQDVPVIPGVATATEITAALDLGITTVKLFPAEQLGGLAMIDVLHGPFPEVRFVPTGGIGPRQLEAYLAHPAVTAAGGSWMAARSLIRAERFADITRLTADAVALAAS
jgi:2-dehydro-3-deoxyphosphogluconate aldolase/(4S)-4-hydroxy-2-oxoglutarate aldolase